jgi:hypothetical protein
MARKTIRSPIHAAIAAWFAVLLIVTLVSARNPINSARSQSTNSGVVSPMRLVLHSAKRIYHAKQPIHVRAYLENTSTDQTFYIGRELGGFCSILSFHFIELRITDERNRRIPTANSAGAAAWREGTTQREKIRQEYVPLVPKRIYAQNETCEIRLKRGRYRMQAVYHEFEATEWKGTEALDFPVWTRTLRSNVVHITVVP